MKRIVFFAIALMIPVLGFGKVEGIYRGRTYIVDTKTKILEDKYLQVFGLTLWDSSLQDALEKIGSAPIAEDDVAPPHTSAQVCYAGKNSFLFLTSPDTPHSTSPREQQRISSIIISRNKHIEEAFAPCRMNPKMREVIPAGGLYVGMTKAEVKQIWGAPGKETEKVMIYEIRRIQNRYFTDDVSVYIEFSGGKLSYAGIGRRAID